MTENRRIDDLWFSTDGLVLKAENNIFRVTKSILAARSSVFRDMVAFPQPPGDEAEIIDGCPVVHLHDSAADVEVFLRAIFDSSYFMPPPEPVELHVLLGILRLSHKYDVHYLFLRALKHLGVRFVPTAVDQVRLTRERDHIQYPDDQSPCTCLTSIILAAKAVGALWLLPFAYYEVSSYAKQFITPALAQGADRDTVNACFAAQIDLSRGTSAAAAFLSVPSDGECSDPQSCNAVRFRQLALYFDDTSMEWDVDPLGGTFIAQGFCSHCLHLGKEHQCAVLAKFWDQLPGIYHLPPWPELHTMRDVVMGETA
ncbi:hypothetical protein DFH06DRAFT_1168850 [Mycena polygramma]|nr:hypothetical protein DFH06DRAFT_1168850 [Mycena polygramma]